MLMLFTLSYRYSGQMEKQLQKNAYMRPNMYSVFYIGVIGAWLNGLFSKTKAQTCII